MTAPTPSAGVATAGPWIDAGAVWPVADQCVVGCKALAVAKLAVIRMVGVQDPDSIAAVEFWGEVERNAELIAMHVLTGLGIDHDARATGAA